MKNYSSISFVSLSIGWIALLVTYMLWAVGKYGNASEIGALIPFSGFLALLFYLIFIRFPKKYIIDLLGKSNLLAFAIITAFYSCLSFLWLTGYLFFAWDFYILFSLTWVGGFTFGLTFWWLWNRDSLNFDSKAVRITGYLLPVFFVIFYLQVFPVFPPRLVYKYVPHYLREEIEIRTLAKVEVGDPIEVVKQKLPGLIKYDGCRGGTSKQSGEYAYRLLWNCCIIVAVEVGKRNAVDLEAGAELLEQSCE